MSENIFQKAAGLLGKAFTGQTPDPYETPIGEMAGTPVAPLVIRPQAIGSPDMVFGDVPYMPPDFKP